MKIAIKLHSLNKSLFKNPDIIKGDDTHVDFPLLFLGFHHFLHQSEGKLIVKKEFEGKKKVYTVINPYNLEIDDYPEDIGTVSTKYFKKARSTLFLEVWELLNDYKVAGGSFNCPKELVDAVKKKFPKATEGNKGKVELLIVADEFGADDPLYLREQIMFPQYLHAVMELSESLVKGGSFIMRISETFTKTTAKLIGFLTSVFKEVHLVKPAISDPSTADKYVVCVDYSGDTINLGKVKVGKDDKVLDIFTGINIFEDKGVEQFVLNLRKINTELLNEQFASMNRVVSFIQAQNYRGDVYDKNRKEQIIAAKDWIGKYLV